MPTKLVMPERTKLDGEMGVRRLVAHLGGPVECIELHATTAERDMRILCTEYNAWRLLGSLSLLLGVPLSNEAQRAIKL